MNYLDLVHLPATYHSLSPNFPSHLVNFMSSSLWWSSSSSFQDVFLERELLVHQGCIRHEGQQDDRVDGPRRDGHTEGDHKFMLLIMASGEWVEDVRLLVFPNEWWVVMAGDGDEGVHERGVQAGARQLPLPHQEHGEGRHKEVAWRSQGNPF